MSSKHLIKYKKYYDSRGFMSPLVEEEILSKENLCIKYSKSDKGIIRGFHWQKPPFSQEKKVFILSGEIEDLICPVIDNELVVNRMIRNKLKAEDDLYIKIPANYAHAYRAIVKDTLILYVCKGSYNSKNELTIKADKFFK